MEAKLTVRVNLGKTLNLGNYESLRIDASVEDEFIGISYEEAFERVFQAVAGQLEIRIDEVRKRFT